MSAAKSVFYVDWSILSLFSVPQESLSFAFGSTFCTLSCWSCRHHGSLKPCFQWCFPSVVLHQSHSKCPWSNRQPWTGNWKSSEILWTKWAWNTSKVHAAGPTRCSESDQHGERCARSGDWDGAKRIVKYVKKASSNSLHQIIPMRGHLEEVAELLTEFMDAEVQTDASALREILLSIHCSAQEAQKIAHQGKKHFEEVAQEVEELQKQYQSKAEKAASEVEKCQQLADMKGTAAKAAATASGVNAVVSGASSLVPLGDGGLGIVGATMGAEAVASIPLIGAAFTTTTATTASVGGFWGCLGYTVTTTAVAFNPLALMVGTAVAVGFRVLAVKSGVDSAFYSGQKTWGFGRKGWSWKAEGSLPDNSQTVKQSQETQQIAEKMVSTANIHESLWEGVSFSADLAAQKFNQLQRIDPRGSRRYKFDQKMKAYASDLCDLVKAIDEYLLCLEKLGFLPPNFQLESVLGQTRYCEIDKAMKRAQSQLPAALTAPHSSSPAPAAQKPQIPAHPLLQHKSPRFQLPRSPDTSSPAPAAQKPQIPAPPLLQHKSPRFQLPRSPDTSSPAPAAQKPQIPAHPLLQHKQQQIPAHPLDASYFQWASSNMTARASIVQWSSGCKIAMTRLKCVPTRPLHLRLGWNRIAVHCIFLDCAGHFFR